MSGNQRNSRQPVLSGANEILVIEKLDSTLLRLWSLRRRWKSKPWPCISWAAAHRWPCPRHCSAAGLPPVDKGYDLSLPLAWTHSIAEAYFSILVTTNQGKLPHGQRQHDLHRIQFILWRVGRAAWRQSGCRLGLQGLFTTANSIFTTCKKVCRGLSGRLRGLVDPKVVICCAYIEAVGSFRSI